MIGVGSWSDINRLGCAGYRKAHAGRLVCERDRRFESAFPPRAWGSSTFAASRMAAFLKAKLG
jgi:hypothetical protein